MCARRKEPLIAELFESLSESPVGKSIGYNEMEGRVFVTGSLPWDEASGLKARPWGPLDDSYCFSFAQEELGCDSERDFQHALKMAAAKNSYNPVREMLEKLPQWDGLSRVGHLMHWFLGSPNDEYTSQVEYLLFRAAIARTYSPGVKFDHMVVLKGCQGIGKSSFCRKLAMNPDFFTDCITGFGKKEAAELIQGKWIVEVSELAAMRNSQIETIKAFITRQSDDYRSPYARHVESRPRRFVMVGSTNADAFLSDTTGNRRFLPVECGVCTAQMDVNSSDAVGVIAQAWSEAMAYMSIEELSDPEPLILPEDISSVAVSRQLASTIEDPRVGLIGEYLEGKEIGELVCTIEIIEHALDIERKDQKHSFQMQVAEIVRGNFPNWHPIGVRRTAAYGKQRCFQRKF